MAPANFIYDKQNSTTSWGVTTITTERYYPTTKLNLEQSRITMAMQGRKPPAPQDLIKHAMNWFGNKLVVACSFGRCSVAVLHMALQFDPHVHVVFCDTGVEYPETYQYKKKLIAEWHLNISETKPIKNFWQCVKEYGLPLIRGKKTQDGVTRQPACCHYMKDKPMANFAKQYGIQAVITGIRAAESRVRMMAIAYHNNYFFSTKWHYWRIHPIAFWSKQDLLNYIATNNIPVNAIYEKVDRSGCMPCTAFQHWEEQLISTNLKMYKYIQRIKGVNLIDDYLNTEPACLQIQEI